jgi:hypothetical protein
MIMDEREIIRLNIERFRRVLQTETDEATRRTIEDMIHESKSCCLQAAKAQGPNRNDPEMAMDAVC